METTLLHCCWTCLHFRPLEGSCLGECAHPERLSTTDAKIYSRDRELPCRIAWGVDLWIEGPQREPVIRIVDLVIWEGIPGDAALDELPEDLIEWLLRSSADTDDTDDEEKEID